MFLSVCAVARRDLPVGSVAAVVAAVVCWAAGLRAAPDRVGSGVRATPADSKSAETWQRAPNQDREVEFVAAGPGQEAALLEGVGGCA